MLGLQTGWAPRSSACLQCRLQQILLRLSSQRLPARTRRSFSRTTRLTESDDRIIPGHTESSPLPRYARDDEGGYYWRRVKLDNAIVGRGGRRKRQSVATLLSTTLGKPAEVILVRDVEEEQRTKKAQTGQDDVEPTPGSCISAAAVTPEEIEGGIHEGLEVPKQDEVDASIDALRPESLMLDEKQFESFASTFHQSYNIEQLASYLADNTRQAIAPSDTQGSGAVQKVSQWRPGKSKSSRRHDLLRHYAKSNKLPSKNALAKQIMREVWGVTITEEEQRLGEIEMVLKPWQMRLLFDVKPNGRPLYDEFINSEVLLRSSTVDAHRGDSTLRITARRHDAQDMVERLSAALASLVSGRFDLSVFSHLLGQPGWPQIMSELIPVDSMDFIMQSTGSVLEIDDGSSISIHSRNRSGLDTALRTLLSLLHLPYRRNVNASITKKETGGGYRLTDYKDGKSLVLTEFFDTDLHERYRHVDLYRVTAPSSKIAQDYGLDIGNLHQELVSQTCAMLPSHDPHFDAAAICKQSNLWSTDSEINRQPWNVQLAVLLGSHRASDSATQSRRKTGLADATTLIPLPSVAGLYHLLEHFQPVRRISVSGKDGDPFEDSADEQAHSRRLVAHLVPSPFGPHGASALDALPRVRLVFDRTISTVTESSNVELAEVTAQLEEDACKILMPEEATDVIFQRSFAIRASPVMLKEDATIAKFRQILETMDEAAGDGLRELSEVNIRLPAGLVARSRDSPGDTPVTDDQASDVPVPYSWQSLEEVETIDFQPCPVDDFDQSLNRDQKTLLRDWPDHFVLRLNQVEAGAVGGRRTEIHLVNVREEAEGRSEDIFVQDSKTAVSMAFALANFLTRMNLPGTITADDEAEVVEEKVSAANSNETAM